MGTYYYLSRPDNETLFILGKGLLNEAFENYGAHYPVHLDADKLPQQLEQAIRNYAKQLKITELDEAEVVLCGLLVTKPLSLMRYAHFVAEKMLRWAKGKPVLFLSEQDSRLDTLSDDSWDWYITGDYYVGSGRLSAWELS